MKKICLFIMVLLGLASCSDQLTVSEKESVIQSATQVDDEYHYYLEKARWGEAGAYVKLADFYREGKYVNSDFMGMTAMLAMAEQYDRNHRLKDYIKALPEDDSYRLMFEAMDEIGRKDRDKVKDVASFLVANGKPEGYVINGAMQVEEGDTIGGLETIRYGAEQGSSFGKLILCMAPAFMGTTTMKCASSAEADVFAQAVALFIAVTPQTARRCNLPVWLLLRAATIAFATNLLD